MQFQKLFLFVAIASFTTLPSNAQNIKAGLIGGFNATQVEGDGIKGYHKFGINAGVVAMVPIDKKWYLSLGINYIQRGARSRVDKAIPGRYFLLRLNYAEIPIQINFNDKNQLIFSGGFTINSLVNFHEERNGVEFPVHEDNYNRRDWNFTLGATFLASPSVGVNMQWNYSILPMGKSISYTSGDYSLQSNNSLSFRMMWFFAQAWKGEE